MEAFDETIFQAELNHEYRGEQEEATKYAEFLVARLVDEAGSIWSSANKDE
jgi:hypothetical protein